MLFIFILIVCQIFPVWDKSWIFNTASLFIVWPSVFDNRPIYEREAFIFYLLHILFCNCQSQAVFYEQP